MYSIKSVTLVGTHKEARSLGEISAFEKLNYFDFFKLFQTNCLLSPDFDSVIFI